MWTSIVANKVTFFLPRSADGKKKKGTQREVGIRNCYDEIHSWTVPLLIALKLQQTAKSILWTLMQPKFFDEGYFLCQKKELTTDCSKVWWIRGIHFNSWRDFRRIKKQTKTTCGQRSGADIFNLSFNNLLLRGSLSDRHVAAQLTFM